MAGSHVLWLVCALAMLGGAAPQPSVDVSAANTTLDHRKIHAKKDDGGCPALRSKRYISDGPCASVAPIHEVVCVDWYAHNSVAHRRRCVDGQTRRRRVQLLCQDGSRRFYHVRVVKSCRRQPPRTRRRHP